jgi:hypothetical protein
MIPPGDPPAREGALALFDRELRDSRDWQGWENNKVHKYAIRAGDRLYPVKQIVSLATEMPVSEFSGGEGSGQAKDYVRDRGFEVVPLRQRNPKWPRDELSSCNMICGPIKVIVTL